MPLAIEFELQVVHIVLHFCDGVCDCVRVGGCSSTSAWSLWGSRRIGS
jgi:hypothetical protein